MYFYTTFPQGADGLSAYEIAVANGFVGTEEEWLASLVGPAGASSSFYDYKADAVTTTGDPGSTYLGWNNLTQIDSTVIRVNHVDKDGIDVNIFLSLLDAGDNLIIQDASDGVNFQTWEVQGPPTEFVTYDEISVTLVESGGTGTTNFSNNHEVILVIVREGPPGTGGGGGGSAALVLSDFVSPYSYIGVAAVGSATSDPAWTITRIDTTPPVSTATAALVAWDNRLTETYT